MHEIEWLLIISIAFAGSFGHCIGMCGGFIVAYSSAKIDSGMSVQSQFIRHSAYNVGRVVSYTIMGIIFGAIGSIISWNMDLHGTLFIIAGIIMIITALGMVGLSKIIHLIEHSFTSLPWFKKLFSDLIKNKSIGSFFALGMMNGFFPCGFVFFFAAKAAASASIIKGGLIMAIFGLATVPTLLMLGQSVSFMRQVAFRQMMNRIAALAIFIYGIYSIYYGLVLLFDWSL